MIGDNAPSGANVIMAGIDHGGAALAVREGFSFAPSAYQAVYARLLEHREVEGAVILSTCNRTELYLSLKPGCVLGQDPFALLCSAMGRAGEGAIPHKLRRGPQVLPYLCALASGMESQIWGEEQIITQVKNALVTGREYGATDSVLEVLFRTAVTAGKKVRSEIHLGGREASAAQQAVEAVVRQGEIRRVLVIGNGEIGRLTAQGLAACGCDTAITLRQYRHGISPVPKGVRTVAYGDRYGFMERCQAVVSATLSPHYTMELQAVRALSAYPRLYVDLAVPRDIDPRIGQLAGVTLYDIDSLSVPRIKGRQEEQRAQAQLIINKYLADFDNWYRYKTQALEKC